ncbi:hypothetical protein BKA65DRAFT_484910 [Rhexocercosporidium sp. MPI-PUGE-AT-0058]|nr:hypothetical protein BKA65DRAFT_484910 [Rhexocercosporidium sp. MPI-PUGE-AT-0058]
MDSNSTAAWIAIAFGSSSTVISLFGLWIVYRQQRILKERSQFCIATSTASGLLGDQETLARGRNLSFQHALLLILLLCSENDYCERVVQISRDETRKNMVEMDVAEVAYAYA